MSALWADIRPDRAEDRSATPSATRRPVLIQGGAVRGRLGRVPFVLVLMALFGLGMAGLLALNTTLQGQAFAARSLHNRATQLTYQQAALERQVDDLHSVDKLAARAFGMGMRPDPEPAFLRLPDGRVIGKPTPVAGNEVPGLVNTPEQIKAKREASAAKKKAAEARRQAAAARREAEQQRAKDQGRAASNRAGSPGTQQNGGQQTGAQQNGAPQKSTGNQGGQG